MKKTEKAGLGHLKKMEKMSREAATHKALLATQVDTRKMGHQARRGCALPKAYHG